MSRALIVDDSSAVRMLLARTLHQFGYEILEAANGREALGIIAAETAPVQLVLADWNMPVMNGLEMVKHLRQDPRHASLVVVMVTSESDPTQMTAALLAGANEYVMKPFTREILKEKLEIVGALSGGTK
jgi:two-component system, chemotaxis family, chemotaxis protein CheY